MKKENAPRNEAQIRTVLAGNGTISEKIRDLFDCGAEVSEIAKLLDIRYNFAYNVASKYRAKLGKKAPAKAEAPAAATKKPRQRRASAKSEVPAPAPKAKAEVPAPKAKAEAPAAQVKAEAPATRRRRASAKADSKAPEAKSEPAAAKAKPEAPAPQVKAEAPAPKPAAPRRRRSAIPKAVTAPTSEAVAAPAQKAVTAAAPKPKYSFIGCGNMAEAIVRSMLGSGFASAADISAYDKDEAKTSAAKKAFGIGAAKDAPSAANAEYVFLAVKPSALDSVIAEIRGAVSSAGATVVTIAAGKPLSFYKKAFGFDVPVIRVMPNVNVRVSSGMSALCRNERVSDEAFALALDLFGRAGKAISIPEQNFHAFVGLSGSFPAAACLFIESAARAGVLAGFDKKTSLEIVANAVLGSAKLLLESGEHPWSLIDTVCTPGGTTIEGIASLLEDGFEASVIRSISAVIAKDERMA